MFSSTFIKKINPRLVKAAVFGANDGIVTTFAVVAGVSGAQLSADVVMVMGISNLVADGLSMGLGDYLGEKSENLTLETQGHNHLRERLWMTGLVTFIAFGIAGSMPLLPYFLKVMGFTLFFDNQFLCSSILTVVTLFLVGVSRGLIFKRTWWKNGLEMLGIGSIAAIAAYVLGAVVEGYLR